ncbi:IVa2, partial [Red-eared slider adenovirus 1]|uniref:IVa2 n=1 Tax=Red-eared slider adenovirus 1 TaxID=2749458 RepID=UPI002481D863
MERIRSDLAARQLYYKMSQWAQDSAQFDPIKLGPKAEALPSFEDFMTLTPNAPDLTQFIENDLALTHAASKFARGNGTLKSFNFGKKPFIVCIY